MKILLYTHSDYSDVCDVFLSQLKSLCDYTCIAMCDKPIYHERVENTIIYDDSKSYTERVYSCLENLNNDDIFLFTHEDMILYDVPNIQKMNRCISIVSNDIVEFVRLLRGSDESNDKINDFTYRMGLGSNFGFTIQPTIIKISTLKKLFQNKMLSIWDFECITKNMGISGAYTYCGEKKRGMFHYDSIVYPYIATAIVKGKWNVYEYNEELSKIVTVDTMNKRGFFRG